MVSQAVITFKDTLIPPSNAILRNNYISAKHSSHAVLGLIKQIQFLKYKFNEEDGKQKLAIILSILEPAIVNDENATIGIHLELIELLQDFILFALEEYTNNAQAPPKSTESSSTSNSAPLYLKLTVRCLTSCLRLELGVNRYAKQPQNISDLMKLADKLNDEEAIANSCKCIRISLRDEKVREECR